MAGGRGSWRQLPPKRLVKTEDFLPALVQGAEASRPICLVVAEDPDSLCVVHVLQDVLTRRLCLGFKLYVVRGYSDFFLLFDRPPKGISECSTLVFVNIGARQDIRPQLLQLSPIPPVFIVDCHRPLTLHYYLDVEDMLGEEAPDVPLQVVAATDEYDLLLKGPEKSRGGNTNILHGDQGEWIGPPAVRVIMDSLYAHGLLSAGAIYPGATGISYHYLYSGITHEVFIQEMRIVQQYLQDQWRRNTDHHEPILEMIRYDPKDIFLPLLRFTSLQDGIKNSIPFLRMQTRNSSDIEADSERELSTIRVEVMTRQSTWCDAFRLLPKSTQDWLTREKLPQVLSRLFYAADMHVVAPTVSRRLCESGLPDRITAIDCACALVAMLGRRSVQDGFERKMTTTKEARTLHTTFNEALTLLQWVCRPETISTDTTHVRRRAALYRSLKAILKLAVSTQEQMVTAVRRLMAQRRRRGFGDARVNRRAVGVEGFCDDALPVELSHPLNCERIASLLASCVCARAPTDKGVIRLVLLATSPGLGGSIVGVTYKMSRENRNTTGRWFQSVVLDLFAAGENIPLLAGSSKGCHMTLSEDGARTLFRRLFARNERLITNRQNIPAESTADRSRPPPGRRDSDRDAAGRRRRNNKDRTAEPSQSDDATEVLYGDDREVIHENAEEGRSNVAAGTLDDDFYATLYGDLEQQDPTNRGSDNANKPPRDDELPQPPPNKVPRTTQGASGRSKENAPPGGAQGLHQEKRLQSSNRQNTNRKRPREHESEAIEGTTKRMAMATQDWRRGPAQIRSNGSIPTQPQIGHLTKVLPTGSSESTRQIASRLLGHDSNANSASSSPGFSRKPKIVDTSAQDGSAKKAS